MPDISGKHKATIRNKNISVFQPRNQFPRGRGAYSYPKLSGQFVPLSSSLFHSYTFRENPGCHCRVGAVTSGTGKLYRGSHFGLFLVVAVTLLSYRTFPVLRMSHCLHLAGDKSFLLWWVQSVIKWAHLTLRPRSVWDPHIPQAEWRLSPSFLLKPQKKKNTE